MQKNTNLPSLHGTLVTSYESQKKKKKEGNTFGAIEGYDSDVVLMNKALHKFFSHSGKCSQRKGRLKKKLDSKLQ